MTKATLCTDGGSRGNPGPSGLGYVLKDETGAYISKGGWPLGSATNNIAEYSALIWGLENARAAGVKELEIRADSQLMIRQMKGEYKVKSEVLKPLFASAQSLAACFESVSYVHVYREDNKEADLLVNEALDASSPLGTYAVSWEPITMHLFEDTYANRAQDPQDDSLGTCQKNALSRENEIKGARYMDIEKNEVYTGPGQLSGESYENCGGTYEMTIKGHFDAAHTLPGYDGPCRFLHGHTWEVEATVVGEKLDSVGIVYDFKALKKDLNALLENFDHRYINDVPPFDTLNPTAENLARVLFYELQKTFPPTIKLREMILWESPSAKVVYRP